MVFISYTKFQVLIVLTLAYVEVYMSICLKENVSLTQVQSIEMNYFALKYIAINPFS